ncbi:uncharacterized protein LOC111376233 [Olea europaea var. sylvestris]|uniref:uncharacterized protein LOC111376233 n=1 Tax=Olea europaea var. sylvestris TaxID=158386 RepID=UPI000C1D2C03|nr:uncharacterized protein LOC111376233 [Olea europaea var. sylvestris]
MSIEELKIRSELENDVERDLEEEIKDGIYHLALRLHRLYQHQKERHTNTETKPKSARKMLSEVNISIKMEGGTTIQIKEIKKQEKIPPNPMTSTPANNKKVDWEKTLRSNRGITPSIKSNKTESKHVSHLRKKPANIGKINISNASRQRKVDLGAKTALLELGWKY